MDICGRMNPSRLHGCEWLVYTPLLFLRGKRTWYHWIRSLVWLKSGSERWREEKDHLLLPEIESRFPGHAIRRLVTTLSESGIYIVIYH